MANQDWRQYNTARVCAVVSFTCIIPIIYNDLIYDYILLLTSKAKAWLNK